MRSKWVHKDANGKDKELTSSSSSSGGLTQPQTMAIAYLKV